MPTPEGFITTSNIWQVNPETKLEEVQLPEEEVEEEVKEEE